MNFKKKLNKDPEQKLKTYVTLPVTKMTNTNTKVTRKPLRSTKTKKRKGK